MNDGFITRDPEALRTIRSCADLYKREIRAGNLMMLFGEKNYLKFNFYNVRYPDGCTASICSSGTRFVELSNIQERVIVQKVVEEFVLNPYSMHFLILHFPPHCSCKFCDEN